MIIRIHSRKQVWAYTGLITLICASVPVIVVGGLLAAIPGMTLSAILWGVAVAALIPLLIAPPIAYVALTVVRLLSETISKVDAHIRFDPLTGALNRSHFIDSVRASSDGGSLMIIDADHFKRVNDTLGHAAGDDILRSLTDCLQQTVAEAGIIGRLGGEEFGVYLPTASQERGQIMAYQLCEAVRGMQVSTEGAILCITISIGLSQHTAERRIADSLKEADEYLYAAKNAGRDRAMWTGKHMKLVDVTHSPALGYHEKLRASY